MTGDEQEKIKELVLEGLDTDAVISKRWYLEEIAKIVIPGIDFDELDFDRGIPD